MFKPVLVLFHGKLPWRLTSDTFGFGSCQKGRSFYWTQTGELSENLCLKWTHGRTAPWLVRRSVILNQSAVVFPRPSSATNTPATWLLWANYIHVSWLSRQYKETWKYFAQWRLSSAVRDRGMSLQTHFLWVCKPIFYGSANPYFMVLQTHFLWVCKPTFYGVFIWRLSFFKFDFDDGNWQQAEARNLLLVWTVEVNVLLPKERYGDPLNGRGSNTEPYNWEADTATLSYRRLSGYIVIWNQFFLFAKFKVV